MLSSLPTSWILNNGILDWHTAASFLKTRNHALLQAVESILDFSTYMVSYFCCFDPHPPDVSLSRFYDIVGAVCIMLPWFQPLFSISIWTMDYLCNLSEFCHLQGSDMSFNIKKYFTVVVRWHISLPAISTAVYSGSLDRTRTYTGVYACRKAVFWY